MIRFGDDWMFVSGNCCECGECVEMKCNLLFNLYVYKLKCIFDYKLLKKLEVIRGIIGILCVLNVFENYLLWYMILMNLGF